MSEVPMAPSSLLACALPTLGPANRANRVNGANDWHRNSKKSNTKALATSHSHRSCPNLKGGIILNCTPWVGVLGTILEGCLPHYLLALLRGREDCNLICIADAPKPNLSVNSVVSTCFCPQFFYCHLIFPWW